MEENAPPARLGTMRLRLLILALAFVALVAVALVGAALQLVRGERPVLS
jgi:hypothetical protein